MKYSADDTILVYSDDKEVIDKIKTFAASRSFLVYVADSETDIIAVPNLWTLVDINLLTSETFDYIDGLVTDELIDDEIFVSHTQPATEMAKRYTRYFTIDPDLQLSHFLSLSKTNH